MSRFVHRPNGPGTAIAYAGIFQAGYSEEELADGDAELVAFLNPAPVPVPPTPLDWFLRLSQATQAALDVAARTDTAVSLALRYASGVTVVDVADSKTIANVALLRGKGLLTDAEQTLLLTP